MALPVYRNSDVRSWNPLQEMDDLQSRFSKLLEASFGESASLVSSWTPPVDIEETDDSFIVEAELPEVQKDDVDVELDDNRLTIHGEVKERERTGVLRRQSRRTGQFDYRVDLPGKVQADGVDASLKDGVLRLTIRKSEADKPRRIEISS